MPQYDIYPNPSGAGYLLDVQIDLLSGLNTRIVVPVLPATVAPTPARRLNPVFMIEGVVFIMVTQFLSAVPQSLLKASTASLTQEAEAITAAIDMLTQGF